MTNHDRIRSTNINTIEAYLKIYDTPKKIGFLDGSSSGPIATALQKKGWIRKFGFEGNKQLWEAAQDGLTPQDIVLMRKIASATSERLESVPMSSRIYALTDQALIILQKVVETGALENRGIQTDDQAAIAELIEKGFVNRGENNEIRLIEGVMLDPFEGLNFSGAIIDLINQRNERKAAEKIQKERSE